MKNLTKRKYSGIRQRNVNEIVWNIYGYKFFNNISCLFNLKKFAIEDLSGHEFDVIVPIKPRNSGSDIVKQIAWEIADKHGVGVADCLNNTNTIADKSFSYMKGYRVLIIDDVITTGRTAAKAEKAIRAFKPQSVQFYALAKASEK